MSNHFVLGCINDTHITGEHNNTLWCLLVLTPRHLVTSPAPTPSFPSVEELCLDISGGSNKEGAYLIGHSCTGRWNQIIHIQVNRISSKWKFVQPAVYRLETQNTTEDLALCISMDRQRFLQTLYCNNNFNADSLKLSILEI